MSQTAAVDAEIAAQFAELGVSVQPETIEPHTLTIHPVNHPSLDAWLACQTQWRVVSTMAGLWWQGLDYPAVRLVIDDIGAPRHVFADLRVMEAVAVPILNEAD